jgi:hypothetical protein
MPTTLPADPGLAARRLYVTTVLAGAFVDRLAELERSLAGHRPELRGKATTPRSSPPSSTTSSPSSTRDEREPAWPCSL